MDPSEDAKLVEFHPVWVAEADEREAIEKACLEEYFGYGLEYFLESNFRLFELMKDYLYTFVFDHRGDDVREGENRWEYQTKKRRTNLGDYGLPECLHVYKYGH